MTGRDSPDQGEKLCLRGPCRRCRGLVNGWPGKAEENQPERLKILRFVSLKEWYANRTQLGRDSRLTATATDLPRLLVGVPGAWCLKFPPVALSFLMTLMSLMTSAGLMFPAW